jgi:hypothetical protein
MSTSWKPRWRKVPSGRKAPVGDDEMQVWVPVDQGAEGLDGGDDAGDDVRFAEGGAQEVAERAVGDATEDTEERAVVEEEGSQTLGHGEDVLAVRDGVEEMVLEPVGPDREPFGMAGRTQLASAPRGPPVSQAGPCHDDASRWSAILCPSFPVVGAPKTTSAA